MSTTNYIELHRKTKGIVLYDGPCKLCNDAVLFLLKRDAQAYFIFGSLQSKVAQNFLKEKGIDPSKTDSLVFVTATDIWMRSNAVLHVCSCLKGRLELVWNFSLHTRINSRFLVRFYCKEPLPVVWKNRFLQDAKPSF